MNKRNGGRKGGEREGLTRCVNNHNFVKIIQKPPKFFVVVNSGRKNGRGLIFHI
jgi:hypothetical protein